MNCLVTGNVVEGPDLGKLRSALRETLGAADIFLCGSGSLALEMALRTCGVGAGDQVVIPTFCCSALVPPIRSLGAVPVLADAGAELNVTAASVEAVLGKKTKAIIVPHLFGNPAEIGSITGLAKDKNIFVIDDAAQALGATIGGRPVGTFGDAGIVSFGVEKICSGVGGGAVMITNDVLAEPIDKDALPPPAVSAALRNGLSNLVWRRWRRWSLPLESAVDRSRCSGPDAAPSPYPKVAMANLNAAVAFSLMETLRENIAARRARVAAYQGLLGCDERIRFITQRPGSACLTQVVRVSPRRRGQDSAARVIEGLRREGYEVQGSYVPIHLLPGFEQCVRGELWHAEKIWPDLIELPCEPTVALGHVERIAEIIKHALGRVDGHKRGAA